MNKNTIITFITNMNTPSFITDKKGNVIFSNGSMRYICEKIGIKDISHVDKIAIVIEEEVGDGVVRFHIAETKLEGFKYVIRNDEGDINYIYTVDKSAATDRMVDKVMEHIDEIVVIFNKDGTIERMNSICDNILPFKRKDVIGKNIITLVDEGVVQNPIIVELIETKEKVYRDIVYPNGKIISYTAVPVFGSAGNFRGGVLTGRDISRLINLVKGDNTIEEEANEYISVSKDIEEIKNIISHVAPSDASVFILGESGVGKEVLTKTIWKKSDRRDKPFVAINCAAIPNDLIESELFGYEKGAFTGANKEGKIGLLESAHGGTVFLDEIGELPLETQKKLLRVIQEKSIMRIGGVKAKKIDLRFISATNKSIFELQDPKVFRQDLFYRLNVIPISIPPLRQRKDDIVPLCTHYINIFNKKYSRHISLTDNAVEELLLYNWPGNIRELKNVIERLVILSKKDKVEGKHVNRILKWGEINQNMQYGQDDENESIAHAKILIDKNIVVNDIMDISEAHRIVEQEILKRAVDKFGNISDAAKAVGINPSTVYRKIKSGQIEL